MRLPGLWENPRFLRLLLSCMGWTIRQRGIRNLGIGKLGPTGNNCKQHDEASEKLGHSGLFDVFCDRR